LEAAVGIEPMNKGSGNPDPQYRALKGVWKDTFWGQEFGGAPGPASQTIFLDSTHSLSPLYRRFVLHCHILDHEDQGMMQNVRIVLPDGAGGTTHPHPCYSGQIYLGSGLAVDIVSINELLY